MRQRGLTEGRLIGVVLLTGVLSFGAAFGGMWLMQPIGPTPEPVPVQVAPALVIVVDSTGKRIENANIEAIADQLPLGTFSIQAIPAPGQTGWTRYVTVSEAPGPVPPPKPPVPPTPPPVPPVPPPVPPTPVPGQRAVLIIRETADGTPELSRLLVALRSGPQADYLRQKGHTLHILDDDSVDQNGRPSPIVEAWRPHIAGMTLPLLIVIDPATSTPLLKEFIAPTATAEQIVARVKEYGG